MTEGDRRSEGRPYRASRGVRLAQARVAQRASEDAPAEQSGSRQKAVYDEDAPRRQPQRGRRGDTQGSSYAESRPRRDRAQSQTRARTDRHRHGRRGPDDSLPSRPGRGAVQRRGGERARGASRTSGIKAVPRRAVAGIGGAAAALVIVVAAALLLRGGPAAPDPALETAQNTLRHTLAQASQTYLTPTLEGVRAGALQQVCAQPLTHDEQIAWIGEHLDAAGSLDGLDAYKSYHALALTSRVSAATGFARDLPAHMARPGGTAAQPFGGLVSPGRPPKLYQWDQRWGYATYCGQPLGFTGCGVTVMSMAYMGLTGKTDMTPADMAQLATELGEASGGTNSTFFTNPRTQATLGVAGTRLADTASALTQAVKAGSLVAISVKPNTLAGGDHYVLACEVNDEGKVRVNDPNSPTNTATWWEPTTLIDYENSMVALTKA